MDEQIKPVAWVDTDDLEYLVADGEVCADLHNSRVGECFAPLYSQQSIDALRAEVGELHMHAKRRDQYAVEKAAQALDWKNRAERAEAELEALRWVVEQYVTLQTDGGGRWRVEFGYTSPVTYGPWADSRMDAIDAARKVAG